MTGAGSAAYVWDARNRLTSAPGMAGAVYDFLGRRQHASFGADMASWLYDGGNPVQEASSVNGGAVVLNGLGLDRRFTRTEGANASTLLTDHLGSTLALTNASGAATTRYAYAPYGATTPSGAASDNPYQFTGRQNDGNGLYYYRARYYNPAIGRFISEDPIGLRGGGNLYGYAAQSPVRFRDSRGKKTVVVINNNVGDDPISPYTGMHAGLYIGDGSEDGNQTIYDPGGSYTADGHYAGSDDQFSGQEANIGPYFAFQQSDGLNVQIYIFNTTPQQEQQIRQNINQQGGASPLMCALSVSAALNGIGPFANLGVHYTPSGLGSALSSIGR